MAVEQRFSDRTIVREYESLYRRALAGLPAPSRSHA
jgi:hypothetical protein